MTSPERIIIVRNPASSHAREVESRVVAPLVASSPLSDRVHEFWTPSANSSETTDALCASIQPGDTLINAAGDGTGNALVNAYLQANAEGTQLAFWPGGNFNDMAHTFSSRAAQRNPNLLFEQSTPVDVSPLEITKNGERYRYALLYATLGWTARAAATFDNPEARRDLQNGKANLASSLTNIAKMYFKTRTNSSLPPYTRAGNEETQETTTDILAVNGPIMAKIIRSNQPYYNSDEFLSSDLDVSKFFANSPLLARSAFNLLANTRLSLPGVLKREDTLSFETATLPLQLDGEFESLNDVSELKISKNTGRTVTVLKTTK